ncbi:Hypothetical_protein [Hexamita inflata]|uniref:Hypothetical_protein n=1 Tax=Hexamita inflata TaxID=28002 RepID=A0AA86Q782_9EUKA|nr:Hypothetical protein HINF_LOCUS40213 [Hexamita inflata]
MKNLKSLRLCENHVRNFTSVEKHTNFNNRDQFNNRCFDVSGQIIPSEDELKTANKMRNVENPNNSLKQIQNKRKTAQKKLKQFKQKINAVLNKANNIQFTSSAVRLFEQLNQTVSQ